MRELLKIVNKKMYLLLFILGIITFLIMACRQSVWTGVISLILITFAIICKYKMIKNRQKYEKETRAKKSEAMSTFIDFVQNIITVKKLNIRKYCIDSLSKKNDEYISIGKKSKKKKADTNLVFHLLMSSVYIVVLVSSLIMTKNGGDALPYLLFYFSLLGNLYGDINSIVYMIDSLVSFNTAKKQLDEKITNMIEKYLTDKTYVIVTHRPRLTGLCNKHYRFENHIMSEALYNARM